MKTTQIITFAAAAVAMAAPAAHATGDDSVGTAGDAISNAALSAPLAASSGNQNDPAVIPYDPSPSNPFSPIYTISPTGPEDVTSNVSSTGEVLGTQDFSVSSLGFPVDTFTGDVQYTPTSFVPSTGLSGIVDELSQDLGLGGGYTEEISTSGSGAGTVLPESTGFLVSEYGFGYGNVFEESVNAAGTQSTVGDFLLTPFGDINISPIVDLFATTSAG
ncbi:hypothetical protein [Mycobacterium sp.]|uniref:hypothetical protein n=1 Tax=Mycobacterium sp. TaxID=1785 RepID=UPI0031CF3D53